MEKIKIRIKDSGEVIEVERGTTFLEIVKMYEEDRDTKILAVKFNNNIRELWRTPNTDGELEFLDLRTLDGVRIYQRGILFILHMAIREINPEDKLLVHHTIGSGLYCELKSGIPSEEKLNQIKSKMIEIVKKDIPFRKETIDKFEAIKLFEEDGQEDKALLFRFRKKSTVNVYWCGKYFNYFYGYMPPSTGYLDKFDLIKIEQGFVVVHPNVHSPVEIPEFKHLPKLSQTFLEYKDWLKILDIDTVGELNEIIAKGPDHITELIRVSETLHEKKLARIADEIVRNKKVRVILIAGPSSSGKTTTAKRLALQLKVNGLRPVPISLDDYFLDREKTPRDENGNYDFESIYALDLDLFNRTLKDLIEGKEVEIPRYNFVKGKREWVGRKLKIDKDQPLIIEGIHGLNEMLTESIPRENKFKLYVSALTQMNLDSMNRISTTDTRLVRRTVRDFKFRGHSALDTLKMWPNVRRGEEKYIFPFQEEADMMFNSSLAYELAVLKIFAEPLLLQIDNSVPEYTEAKRLLKFLDYFLPITELEEIPKISILREFIGRSTFKY